MPGLGTADRNIGGFGEAESEAAAFFETNRCRGFAGRNRTRVSPTLRNGIVRIPAHEQAGGLNRQARARELD